MPRSPVIAEFGKCLVRQAPDRSRALLLTEIDSRDERSRAGSLATGTGQCIGSRPLLSMRIGEIRGTVAAALLQEDRLAVERLRQLPAAAPVRPAPARGRAEVNAFARCIADASPSGSTALILAEVGSQAELEAFRAIAPVLDSCVPTDASAQISQFDLRNHIAPALYAMAFPPVAKEVATR